MRSFASLSLTLALLAPMTARAHGGRPQTYDVLFGTTDTDLVVPSTFGVMSSTDGGASWDWLCIEGMPDARRGSIRPAVRAADDRVLFAQHFGLVVGAQRDCAPTYDAELHERYVADVVARPGGGVVAVSSDADAANSLYLSATGSEAFAPIGATFPIGFLPERVRFAPGDPMHVFVSGETVTGATYSGVLFVSLDGGEHWDTHDIALESDEHVLRALAVDPADPSHVFLVAQSTTVDRVIEVRDDGLTATTALALMATPIANDRPMVLAFASDGSIWLGNTEAGLYTLDATGALQTVDKFLRVACIVPRGDDLYLCGDGLDDDFALAVQHVGEDYAPRPLMVFSQLDEQRLCGTELDAICAGWWNDLLLDTGRPELIPDAGPEPDAGSPDAGASDASSTFDASTTTPAPASCACSAHARTSDAPLALLALFAWLVRRRAR